MTDHYDVDLVIVGMGSAGMTAAEFAARLGLRVVVVERDRVGGDCLWTGCVPSKALIAAARTAHDMRRADRFGLIAADPEIDLAAVWRRVRAVRTEIAAGDDDPARFARMGVDLRRGAARLTGPHEVAITSDDATGPITTTRVTTAMVLLCTGSRPAVPDVPGLVDAGYLTSESLFELEQIPGRLVFVGGGPIAVELAQACRRLGIETTVLQRSSRLLPKEEPELADQLTTALRADGVDVCTRVEVVGVEPGPTVVGRVDGAERRWPTDAIVVATGRRVDVDGLGLAELGVATNERGVVVDARMRTSVPSIYAAGDVAGRELFTHAAGYQAVRAIRDAFFPGRGTADALVPWATFTDPELAHAGLTATEARKQFGNRRVRVHRWSLDHNDRAHTDDTGGAIVLVERVALLRSRLVGAHVLADHAGELIGELVMAIERGLSASELGGIVHVYPTIAMSIQQLG
ncbi:MAG: FAD-dependent oxidoreductase, partial [Acidimicrobiia bacterium]|nr:FAD-dependent oxidoreductase [Acidimicrobiia bacterium]